MTNRGVSDLDLIRDAMEIAYTPVQCDRSEALHIPCSTKPTRTLATSSPLATEHNHAQHIEAMNGTNCVQELDHDSLFEDGSDRDSPDSSLSPPRVVNPYKYGIEHGHLLSHESIMSDARRDSDLKAVSNRQSASLYPVGKTGLTCATTRSYTGVHYPLGGETNSRRKDRPFDQPRLQRNEFPSEHFKGSQADTCHYFSFRNLPQNTFPRVLGDPSLSAKEHSRFSQSRGEIQSENGVSDAERLHLESEITKVLDQSELSQSYRGRNGNRTAAGQMVRDGNLHCGFPNEDQTGFNIASGRASYNQTCIRRMWLDSLLHSPRGSVGSQESIDMEISPEDESQSKFNNGHHFDSNPFPGRTPYNEPSAMKAWLHGHSKYPHGSEESRQAIDMEMSPEEQFLLAGDIICVTRTPKLIGYPSTVLPPQSKNFLSPCLQDRSSDLGSPTGLFGLHGFEAQQHRTIPEAGTRGSSSMLSERYPISSFEKTTFDRSDNFIIRRPVMQHDNSSKPEISDKHTSHCSSSPLPTPSHLTPPHHSPLKWVDSPSQPKRMVHQSVEKDVFSHPYVRESTPAYEDRSLSPSPISRTNKNHEGLALDTMMVEAPCESSHHITRDLSSPVTPDTHRDYSQGDVMRPPPSPSRSHTASPGADIRSYREASPSTLRSPAIARVLNQSHSPHGHTRYPSSGRSLSPEARPCHHYFPSSLNLSSVSQPQFSPPLEKDRYRVSPDEAMDKAQKGFPAPPPIPDSPPPLKPAKRGGRRKSLGANSGAKIVKNRTATTNAGTSIVVDGKGKGKRSVTVTKRQRAVTAGLASEKQWRQGDQGGRTGSAGTDAMDVDTDIDGQVSGHGAAESTAGKVDPNATPSPLRRSTRLRKLRP